MIDCQHFLVSSHRSELVHWGSQCVDKPKRGGLGLIPKTEQLIVRVLRFAV